MKTKELVFCAVFAAITAIIAPISIPIGAVPVSLGLTAVFLTGGVLKPKYAFISQVVYLLIGCIGMPVFTGFAGGLQKLVGPTGGYLFVYPVMALVIALVMKLADRKGQPDRKWAKAACMFGGILLSIVICYTSGSLWYSFQAGVPLSKSLAVTVYPFVPWDIAKAVVATVLSLAVRRRIR